MPVPEYPVLFNKFINTIAAHGEDISLPVEAELVIVIGERAKDVPKERALDFVAGYCNVNDLSARDLQFRTNQWLLGKCCDGFSPIGLYIVSSDEIGNPNQLEIKTIVNGEVRQHSNTFDMIFHCDVIVRYISRYMTLEPGDIILTGTPEGVIFGYPKEK
ncbi:2-keto-4-pentenoate hydratase/2-oxohepta-3-ene-1,7-dioic acid hydratase in catechol pathway [Neobacillus niacini]|nr:2-keto-4-pentenoate hydratase/2-oxohepta-3-ene-1,7-dioic acid hydratase in catechol pathway [Neobacillus niacini]